MGGAEWHQTRSWFPLCVLFFQAQSLTWKDDLPLFGFLLHTNKAFLPALADPAARFPWNHQWLPCPLGHPELPQPGVLHPLWFGLQGSSPTTFPGLLAFPSPAPNLCALAKVGLAGSPALYALRVSLPSTVNGAQTTPDSGLPLGLRTQPWAEPAQLSFSEDCACAPHPPGPGFPPLLARGAGTRGALLQCVENRIKR